MNLRELNPYVASAFGDWSKAAAPVPTVARLLGPMPNCSPARAAGTELPSAMSGTNAYAVGALADDAGVSAAAAGELVWQRTRHEMFTLAHILHGCSSCRLYDTARTS